VTDILFSWPALLAVTFGYLLGSIPFGLLLTRAAGLGDVRNIGSGNIGATNVLRTGNKGLAAATLLLDALKATAAVYIVYAALTSLWPPTGAAGQMFGDRAAIMAALAGFAAFIGHLYPVWLGFKGGKGVATFIGAALGIYWPVAMFFCLLWLLFAFAFRYSSLAALAASVIASAYPFLLGERFIGLLMMLMTVLIFYKHEANIRRLLAGEEPKIGQKK
jgi:acyl phosphate:glycerol-3-phosphate acyltransferase